MSRKLADRRDFWYRHTNGTLHRKPHFVVMCGGGPEEYFDSSFVRHWWRDGDSEPDPRKLLVARIAFETLKRRMQPQTELGL